MRVASKLSEVAYAVFAVSHVEPDACVATLLQCPVPVFFRIQECLLELFAATWRISARIVMILIVLAETRSSGLIYAALVGFSYAESEVELRQIVHVGPAVMLALSGLSKVVRQCAATPLSCIMWLHCAVFGISRVRKYTRRHRLSFFKLSRTY